MTTFVRFTLTLIPKATITSKLNQFSTGNVSELVRNLKVKNNTSRSVKQKSWKEPKQNFNNVGHTNLRNNLTKSIIKLKKEDKYCDDKLLSLVKEKKFNELALELGNFYQLNRYPSKKTLQILAAVFSSEGKISGEKLISERENLSSLKLIQQICSKLYPKESKWMMNYEHYIAQLMWKSGNYEKSINIFTELFANDQNVLQRKKLSDLTSFLMRHIFKNNLKKYYNLLFDFCKFSLVEKKYFLPSINLFSNSFIADDKDAWEISGPLFVIDEKLKTLVYGRLETVVEDIREVNDIEKMKKLIEIVLKMNPDSSDYLKLCLSDLLMMQCDESDYKSASTTFQYASENCIPLSPNSVQHFLNLLYREKIQAPSSVLSMKYKNFVPKLNW